MSRPPRWKVLTRLNHRIDELEREQAELGRALADLHTDITQAREYGPQVPSFRRELLRWWREVFKRDQAWSDDPAYFFENKLNGYRWARSHGIDHPPVHGVWATIEEIPWADLPDEITIKGAFSHSSRSVLPIRRAPGGWITLTEETVRTSAELAARLTANEIANPRFRGPYFAEELLTHPDDALAKPFEVKSWTFDGEIGIALTRLSLDHHDTTQVRFRYWDDEGQPVQQFCRAKPGDETVPLPEDTASLIKAFRILSSAARRPVARVDLYVHRGQVVFGEMTVLPSPPPVLLPETDRRMGILWEQAEARIAEGVAAGRGLHPEWGDGPRTLLRAEGPWLGSDQE